MATTAQVWNRFLLHAMLYRDLHQWAYADTRSWLYSQDNLRTEITRLRHRHPAAQSPLVPPQRQRASDASLLRRLEAATARIRKLEADNHALARANGERRAAEVLG
ncbi:MAG: transposase [Actinomycetia bacterium]|nr:transposase [Actinomycetes bacterium]